jgi:hypothetical protein
MLWPEQASGPDFSLRRLKVKVAKKAGSNDATLIEGFRAALLDMPFNDENVRKLVGPIYSVTLHVQLTTLGSSETFGALETQSSRTVNLNRGSCPLSDSFS